MENNIHIWDSQLPVKSSNAQLLLWCSYDENLNKKIVSVQKLVEDNYTVLKQQYLSWIYSLGETRSQGKRIIDHLQIRPGFSFWWMTLISEKCNYSASPQITDAIRLLAFNLWSLDNQIDSVRITSDNKALVECVQYWCRERKIRFSWDGRSERKAKSSILRKLYHVLPHTLRALIQLFRYIWTHWSLRGVGLDEWNQSDADITFFSYLSNLDENAENKGGFKSKLWPRLPEELLKNDCKTNWLHIYCPDPSHPTSRDAKFKLEQFNRIGGGGQVHSALESFLSWSVVCKTLADWLSILKFTKRLEPRISNIKCGDIHLWPLFEEEWRSSLAGAPSILASLNLNLLEVAVGMLPKQRKGVYLYEQQAWELALIHAWRSNKHEMLIGAQHATMLDWDMRYFHDSRNYQRLDNNDLPMPDLVAINGPVSLEKALDAGYPKAKLFEVEALRYLYLLDGINKNDLLSLSHKDEITLLILGDYLESNTKIQMELLVDTLKQFPMDIAIILKPHPACWIDPNDYPSIDLQVTRKSLEELMDICDLAYTSPVTSASVDVYCSGMPVITALDPSSLNLSPLRNYDEVFFVSSPSELSDALYSIKQGSNKTNDKKEFFTLNSDLGRWKKLLLASGA